MSPPRPDRPAAPTARPLAALRPFFAPYRPQILLAAIFLLLAAASTLLLPFALGTLVDRGLVAADPGDRIMALREHFLALFAVGAASASPPTSARPSTRMSSARVRPSSRPPAAARCCRG